MKILFIGDVFGELGRKSLYKYLGEVKEKYKPNMIILNGENVAHGLGITEKLYKEIMSMGISCITMGNHTWSKKEIIDFIDDSKIIRPANYNSRIPGNGYLTINYNGLKITVINVLGRIFMGDPLESPFTTIDNILDEIDSDYILVDMHAEATSEKIALGHYLDGRVTAVVGTHTHVPTADNIILPNGTMYITDVGMTGALDGVIGADKNIIINRFLGSIPCKTEPQNTGRLQFNAVCIDTDLNKIDRINIFE